VTKSVFFQKSERRHFRRLAEIITPKAKKRRKQNVEKKIVEKGKSATRFLKRRA
jgi:hypothetical protein